MTTKYRNNQAKLLTARVFSYNNRTDGCCVVFLIPCGKIHFSPSAKQRRKYSKGFCTIGKVQRNKNRTQPRTMMIFRQCCRKFWCAMEWKPCASKRERGKKWCCNIPTGNLNRYPRDSSTVLIILFLWRDSGGLWRGAKYTAAKSGRKEEEEYAEETKSCNFSTDWRGWSGVWRGFGGKALAACLCLDLTSLWRSVCFGEIPPSSGRLASLLADCSYDPAHKCVFSLCALRTVLTRCGSIVALYKYGGTSRCSRPVRL